MFVMFGARVDAVYARTLEHLNARTFGHFKCECGATLGAWNGLVALRYTKLDNVDGDIRDQAQPIATAA